jgi:hypothetical protein
MLMRLTTTRVDQKIEYCEFCKFLSKKVVRGYKSSSANEADDHEAASHSTNELDKPLQKEASLTYVLRKAAELKIDLRRIFSNIDKNELSVIPRSKFIGLLLDIPIGLNEAEVNEIMDNDVNFDNYGNVDYTVILNSDTFCTLERLRLKQNKKKGVGFGAASKENDTSKNDEQKVDNRKVVVEDLLYVDDLEILIYTTIAPKTSNIFITSTKKSTAGN